MEDCYLKECEAVVLESGKDENGFFAVLDKTVMYPEGGGQLSDIGFLVFNDHTRLTVTSVSKKGGIIKHYVQEFPPEPNSRLTVELKWSRRYALMRMHTAQHIISAIALQKFGSSTVGNQIHPDTSRLDLNPSKLSQEDLEELEKMSDCIVRDGLDINIYEVSRKEVESNPEKYRCNFALLPKSINTLRVVDIAGFDVAICGGTHVANTSEVGEFKILKKENKGKGTERITYELVQHDSTERQRDLSFVTPDRQEVGY